LTPRRCYDESVSAVTSRTLIVVWLASAAVLALATLTSFRLGLAADVPTLLQANGARVLLGAVSGAAMGLFSAMRLTTDHPLADLQVLATAAAAASGGFLAASGRGETVGLVLFLAGGVGAGAVGWMVVRALDRPKRWTNLGAALVLTIAVVLASYTSAYARADAVAPVALWLLGDLSRASGVAVPVVLGAVAALVAGAVARGANGWMLLALGLGLGATGPLPFAGTFSARAVNGLAPRASDRARMLASAAASGAVVVAVDAVPRLLIGGYAFPFAVASGMLAIPVFLFWNRARLRAAAGRASLAFEITEVVVIVALTAFAAAQAYSLTRVVRGLT
jgi:hypothetical protein